MVDSYLQVSVAGVKVCRRTVPLLLMVAGAAVAFTQVANPAVAGSLLMLVFTGSEVDQTPILSGTRGQFPVAEPVIENCTWLPGAAARWSALPVAGFIVAVILHPELPPQPPIRSGASATARHLTR
jgi:hypothetical protein